MAQIYDSSVGQQYPLTVTASGWTTLSAKGIVYQTSDGAWRMRFNIQGSVGSSTRTSFTVTVANVTFKSGTAEQAVSAYSDASTIGGYVTYASANAGNGVLQCFHASVATTAYKYSGDVELDSRPSFAV